MKLFVKKALARLAGLAQPIAIETYTSMGTQDVSLSIVLALSDNLVHNFSVS